MKCFLYRLKYDNETSAEYIVNASSGNILMYYPKLISSDGTVHFKLEKWRECNEIQTVSGLKEFVAGYTERSNRSYSFEKIEEVNEDDIFMEML